LFFSILRLFSYKSLLFLSFLPGRTTPGAQPLVPFRTTLLQF
jgi:hypothetical protein